MTRRKGLRLLAWIGLPVLVVAGLVAFWSWDWFIPLVESRASAALGRQVTVAHLHVAPGRIVTVTAEDVRIANPPDFPQEPPFAAVPRLRLDLDLMAWLRGDGLVLPLVALEQPALQARQREDASANYLFDLPAPAGETGSGDSPRIGELRITEGRAAVSLAKLDADFELGFGTQEAAGQEPQLLAEARGRYAGQDFTARLTGGGVLALREADRPWPVALQLANGPTEASLEGTIQDPLQLRGAALKLVLAGPDMRLLHPLIGIATPSTPPFRVEGKLDYAEGSFRFTEMRGRVGRSDLAGDLAVTPGRERPLLTADLHSTRVDLADLGGFVGATPGRRTTPGQTPEQRERLREAEASPRLLPDTPISIPKLLAADVRLRYRGERIEDRNVPLDNLAVEMAIDAGVITLRPVRFSIGQGTLGGNFVLTPQENGSMRTRGDFEMRRVDVSRLLQPLGVRGGGLLGGVGRIEGMGRSLADILGSGNGEVTVVMAGGNLSALVVDLSGLQFGRAILSALGVPERTRIECFIGDFGLRGGVLHSRTVLLETESSEITVGGTVDLRRERLDLRLRTAAKELTVGSLPATIGITGSFKDPNVLPNLAEAGARGAAAAGLGVLAGPLALLPTIQLGVGDNPTCEALARGGRQGRGARR